MADVDFVPYRDVFGDSDGRYIDLYSSTKSEFIGIVKDSEDRLDASFTSLDNLIRKVDNLYGQSLPEPLATPERPVLETPPDLDLGEFNYSPLTDDFTQGPFVVPTAPTLPTLTLPGDVDTELLDNIVVNLPTPPSVASVSVNVPNVNIGNFDPGVTLTNPPSFGTLNLPNKPALGVTPTIEVDIPDISKYIKDIPDAPNIDIQNPDAALYNVDIPTFSSIDVPNVPIVEPLNVEIDKFTSCVKDFLCDAIERMITKASLDKEYEKASYDKALARERETFSITVGDLPASWASKGYMMPPGMLMQMQDRAERESNIRLSEASRDIYSRRRELDLQVQGQALSAGASLYQAESSVFQVQEQLKIQQLQFNQQQALRVFELAIESAKLSAEKISAERAGFDAYLEGKKAQWEGEARKTQIQTAKVQLYQAQVSGVQAQAGVASTVLQATQTELQVKSEQAKAILDTNRLLMDAWSKEVAGEVERFKSNAVYADIIRAQAGVISANATAFQAKAQAKQLELEVASKQADLNLRQQELTNSVFQTASKAEIARVEALTRLADSKAKLKVSAADLSIRKASAIASQYESQNRITSAVVSAASSAYQAAASSFLSRANAKASFFNAVSSYFSAKGSVLRNASDLYRTKLSAQLEFYKGEVAVTNAKYERLIATWNAAFQGRLASFNALVTKTAALAQIPAEIIKSALSAFIVNVGTTEQVQRSKAEYYNTSISNQFSKSESKDESFNQNLTANVA